MANQNDILPGSSDNFEDALVSLEAKDDAKAAKGNTMLNITELESYVDEILDSLPKINRKKLRAEMENMNVSIKQDPHTSDLNNGLSLAQGYKDRLAEIYMLALRDYKTRDRCISMLLDAYNVVSDAKSADKRQGEAMLRYAVKVLQLQASENFMKEVEHMLTNIKSAMDAVSRQISLFDLQLKLGDVRRPLNGASYQSDAEERRYSSGSGEMDWDNLAKE